MRQARQQTQQRSTHTGLLSRLRAEQLPWTEVMDKTMVAAHDEQGATAADVQAACAKVPMHPHMQEASKCFVNSVLSEMPGLRWLQCIMV